MIREDNVEQGFTATYAYDTAGNITRQSKYSYIAPDTAVSDDKLTGYTDFVYSTGVWKDQLVSVSEYTVSSGVATLLSTKTVAYDASGNPTSYKGNTLTWEGRKLKSYGAYTYEYDENGLRTGKSQGSTEYYYNGSLLMGMVSGGNTLLFSYDAAGSVVSVNFNGTEYYYLKNAQSDIIAIVDSNGAVMVSYYYDAWGKPISTTGTMSSTLGTYNPFRYRGYVYDSETGFYYLQSRYYDPSYGRFISADVFMSTGQGLLGNNMYTYCLNNPANGADPCGTCVHRLDFWNDCEDCKAKSTGEKIMDAAKEGVDWIVHSMLIAYFPAPTAIVVGLHYSRNLFNKEYTEEELIPYYEPLDESADKFHQNNQRGGRNRKYVIGDWFSSEVVFFDDGTLNNTPEDEGTLNVYYGESDFLNIVVHGPFDVAPYMIWGNSPADSTTIIDRIMLALE